MKRLYKYKIVDDSTEYHVVADSIDEAIRLINRGHHEYGIPSTIEFIRLESIHVLTEEEIE